MASIVLLDEFLVSKGMPRTAEDIRREHFERFRLTNWSGSGTWYRPH
jgi:hypothetical protein